MRSYELREQTNTAWIPSQEIPVDAMTKDNPAMALCILMTTNQLDLVVKS